MKRGVVYQSPVSRSVPFNKSTKRNIFEGNNAQSAIEEAVFVPDLIPADTTLTVSANRQLIVSGNLTMLGSLTVIGRVVVL